MSHADFTARILDPNAAPPSGTINPDGAPASKRFDVYRNNVAVSLSDALETAFPVVRKLVGDRFFRAMAGVYLRKYPPKSPLMMFYGEAMPQFLRRFEPAKSLRYLPDVAQLELALRESYHAKDAAPIDAQALATLAPDALMRAKITLAPALRTVTSDHPIHGLYLANTQSDAPKPTMRAETVLITRAQFDPEIHLIDPASAAFLTQLQAGQSLGEAMGLAGNTLDLGALLGLLLSQGAIIKIH